MEVVIEQFLSVLYVSTVRLLHLKKRIQHTVYESTRLAHECVGVRRRPLHLVLCASFNIYTR